MYCLNLMICIIMLFLTYIHDRSLFLLSTCASINSVRVNLIVYAQPAYPSEIMQSCKYFQLVSKMITLTYTGRTAILIEAHVLSKKSERSCICMLDFGVVPTVWYFLFFIFFHLFVAQKLSYNSSSIKRTR
jgi:hypothetical protein